MTAASSSAGPGLYIALDTPDFDGACALTAALAGTGAGIKLGKEFFTRHGPAGVRSVAGAHPLFLDLKFHDIPNTVAGAVRAACHLAPHLLTVHAAGGRAMMQAAAQAATAGAEDAGVPRPAVAAVTVLTSLDDADLAAAGQQPPVHEQVRRLATLAAEAGADGVVCSPREIAMLRTDLGAGMRLIVPGIRPDWAVANDQKRTLTPAEAVEAGADALVAGRPVTTAPDPAAAVRRILDEMAVAA